MNIDDTIREVERLYRSVTGTDAPPPSEQPYAAIPAEVDPQRYVEAQVERLSHMLGAAGRSEPRAPRYTPALAVYEGEDERVYRLDVPGVRRADVQVRVEGGSLVVRGERKPPADDELKLRHSEVAPGRFERVVPLPPSATDDELRVTMKDGCLEIRVPVRATASRTIEIQ
jgi:HSP20 family protein